MHNREDGGRGAHWRAIDREVNVRLITALMIVLTTFTSATAQFDSISSNPRRAGGGERYAAPATRPSDVDAERLTADRRNAFPVAEEPKVKIELGSVAGALGRLPEEVSERVFYLHNSGTPGKGWRDELKEFGIDPRRFQYAAKGKGDVSLVVFSLTNGRVTRIGYLLPKLTNEKAGKIAEAIGPIVANEGRRVQFKDGDTNVHFNLEGQRIEKIQGEYVRGIVGGAKGYRKPGSEIRHPAFICVQVDAVDWFLAHSPDITAEVKRAIKTGEVILGMTGDEALVAKLDCFAEWSATEDGIETVSFTRWDGIYQGGAVLREGKVIRVHGKSIRDPSQGQRPALFD